MNTTMATGSITGFPLNISRIRPAQYKSTEVMDHHSHLKPRRYNLADKYTARKCAPMMVVHTLVRETIRTGRFEWY